jgi:N-acetylglucosaminyldiphosphoundecaprenol N-acetyl-beta-D-mannosaminyltransferase
MARLHIGEIPLDNLSLEQIVHTVEEFINKHTPHQIITLNSLMYNYSFDDELFKKTVLNAHVVIPDSVGIALAGWAVTGVKPDRIPGIELMLRLCKFAESKHYKIYLLGAKLPVVKMVYRNLKNTFPELTVCGYSHGYFSQSEEKNIINEISNSGADILFVALNIPEQEKWIYGNLSNLNIPVVMGIGGSFDVISGKLKRAPVWMQSIGLEWLFRFIQQPRRLSRIMDLSRFVYYILKLKCSAWGYPTLKS